MKSLGKVLKMAKVAGTDVDQEMQKFVRAYNDTPHLTTKEAPSILLLGHSRSSSLHGMNLSSKQVEELRQLAIALGRQEEDER